MRPSHQGLGLGRAVMEAAGEVLHRGFQVGALSTGSPGSTSARLAALARPDLRRRRREWRRTPDEDEGVMVLEVTAVLDPTAPIAVEWRPGDSW